VIVSALLVACAASGAGFKGPALETVVAIAGGESGYVLDRPGPRIPPDGTLQDPFGWFQIRVDSRQTGTGGPRDINALRGNPAHQARAAFTISNGGTNWQPWEVYTNGAYRRHLPEARAAVQQVATGKCPPDLTAGGGPVATAGAGGGDLLGTAAGLGERIREQLFQWLGIATMIELVMRALEVLAGAILLAIALAMLVEIVSTPAARQATGLVGRTIRQVGEAVPQAKALRAAAGTVGSGS
jgi:hypothetical protein